MGLATAVGQLKLADRLVALARQAVNHVLRQLAEVVRGIREGEELVGYAIDRRATVHHDVVQVGGELSHRQIARKQVRAKLDDLVPGFPGELGHDLPFFAAA